MMKRFQKSTSLLLALILSLSLTACGGSNDTAGDDWRVSGMVVGSGTITHTGEGSVKVLVTLMKTARPFTETNRIRSCLTAWHSR